jgi:hypothetical protein
VTRKRKKNKRFTVSLSEQDYKRLQAIASAHRPEFTLQYIVNWGIQGILARADDPQLMLELGNPLAKSSR